MGALRGSQQIGQSRTSGSKSVTEREESLLEEIWLVTGSSAIRLASSITTSRSLSSLMDSIWRSSSSSSSPELPAVSSSSSMEGSRCRLRDWWLLDPSPSSPPETENLAIFWSDQIYTTPEESFIEQPSYRWVGEILKPNRFKPPKFFRSFIGWYMILMFSVGSVHPTKNRALILYITFKVFFLQLLKYLRSV